MSDYPTSKARFATDQLPQGSVPESLPTKRLRILILEDVVSDAALVERELRKAQLSFESRCVESRQDFLNTLREFAPDIILSDYSMPQFNALEALHLLQDCGSKIPFI